MKLILDVEEETIRQLDAVCSLELKAYEDGITAGLVQAREEQKHEGWRNFETWCVALYIDNNELSYTHWRHVAKELQDSGKLAEELKDTFEEALPQLDSPWEDLLMGAISAVNWYEIAEHLLEE